MPAGAKVSVGIQWHLLECILHGQMIEKIHRICCIKYWILRSFVVEILQDERVTAYVDFITRKNTIL